MNILTIIQKLKKNQAFISDRSVCKGTTVVSKFAVFNKKTGHIELTGFMPTVTYGDMTLQELVEGVSCDIWKQIKDVDWDRDVICVMIDEATGNIISRIEDFCGTLKYEACFRIHQTNSNYFVLLINQMMAMIGYDNGNNVFGSSEQTIQQDSSLKDCEKKM